MSHNRLRIASVDLPIETHYRACNVDVERLPSGRRRVKIAAAGQYAPDLSAITWTAGVAVGWLGLTDGTTWQSITILSAGPQVSTDYDPLGVSWSLSGIEAPAGSVLVTIAGTAYLARLERAPVEGVPGRHRITISGTTATAPDPAAGTVAVTSAVWSGSMLTLGSTIGQDPESGLLDWTLTGIATAAGAVSITIGGVSYYARMGVSPIGGVIVRRTNGAGSLQRAWGKASVRISGESVSPPSITPGTVAVAGPVYTGNILCRGLIAEVDSATGLYTWTVEGEEP